MPCSTPLMFTSTMLFHSSVFIDAMGDSGMIPGTLRDAAEALKGSEMLRAAMGDDVIDHYVRAAEVEIEDFDRVVTDYEIARGFERA